MDCLLGRPVAKARPEAVRYHGDLQIPEQARQGHVLQRLLPRGRERQRPADEHRAARRHGGIRALALVEQCVLPRHGVAPPAAPFTASSARTSCRRLRDHWYAGSRMTLFVIVLLCALGLWWGARRLNRSQNPPPYPRPGYGRYRVNPYSADRNTAGRTTVPESWCSWAQSPGRDWGEFDTLDEARAWAQSTGYPVHPCTKCNPGP